MTKNEILLAQKEFLFPSIFHYYKEPLVVTRAKRQYVYDADNRQYPDFFGGSATISVGQANDRVNAKGPEQIDKPEHVSTGFAAEPPLAMSLTGSGAWRLGGALQSGIVHAHNAYCYRCPFGLTYPSCEVKCAQDMEDLIRTSTSGRVAGFIGEPIQGVGGFITPPKEYFPIVEKIVRNHGGIFISDEVRTGCGRTGGKWSGIEQWGVTPDIITSAKGLGNGAQLALTVAQSQHDE